MSTAEKSSGPALDRAMLTQVLKLQRETGDAMGRCLVRLGYPNEVAALRALAAALNIRFVRLEDFQGGASLSSLVPSEIVHRAKVVPCAEEDGKLVLAMWNPLDLRTVDDLRILSGRRIERAVCTEKDMETAMERFYGFTVERMIEDLAQPSGGGDEEGVTDLNDLAQMASEPTVVNLVNLIIIRAIGDRASDIHVEPFERELKVKYRIDGILHEMPPPPKHLQAAIISRIKIMADMNIAERYVPQDGHIELSLEGRQVDVRVATIPTLYGESIVMRLLDKSSYLYTLDDIGFEKRQLGRLNTLLDRSHGIILVCGPTGSGKTTTLYAILSAIYTPEMKFITIEDPVEYELAGVNQIPVRPKRGLTFANGLRAIVRQDPDIIMVGEIRDRETADIAIRSALTGHLVFSTLHTNDAAEAITRLLDMGVEPYLIASAVRGVMAQRLVRKICPACNRESKPTETALAHFRREMGARSDIVFYAGAGCGECKQSGYRGRTGIIELLIVDESLRDFVLRRASSAEIRNHVGPQMLTMRQTGWEKVARGITTVEEVLRVTQMDETVEDFQQTEHAGLD